MIKFNFYSKIMLQTITVFGKMTMNWDREMFQVEKILTNSRVEIIATEVHAEASEHFNNNRKEIQKDSL